ncbi:hypothetical protein BDV39DRAFT_209529 [Aspergillus sergii]|uniref:Uncharacterized protein n=1 Tax=Aspergillus sergii TaxID=1034303 RepID=A0A5N6WTG4_9EURO|nr:hypothetical protein BDV39DRAFT_209529 [Aspergillus sergii]
MASQAGRQTKLPLKGPKSSFPTSHEPETKLRAIIDLEVPWNAETNENPDNLKEPIRARIDQEDLEIKRVEGVDILGNKMGLSLAQEATRRATFVSNARQRFLSELKRRWKRGGDLLCTDWDMDMIQKGNKTVHQGDIVEDEVYLIPHSEFDRIALNIQAIQTLNEYATSCTARNPEPEKTRQALQDAIDCLRNAGFSSSYIKRLEEKFRELSADIDTVRRP